MRATDVLAVLALGAASAGAGAAAARWLDRPGIPDAAPRPPPWQQTLLAARATAEAGSMRAAALDVLNEADGDVALAEALDMLGWVGTDDDVPLLESFARSGDPVLAGPAIEALGRVATPPAVAVLETTLDGRGIDRGAAAVALGASGHPRALERLGPLLDDPTLSHSVAWGLAAHGSPEAVTLLARALSRVDPPQVPPVAHALASLAAAVPEADDALHAVLAGPRTPRRAAVFQALAEARDPVVYDLLVRDLQGGAPIAAAQAAWGLGAMGDPRATPLLARASREAHAEVRSAAIDALGALDHPTADRALLELVETAPGPVAARAVHTLPRVDDPELLERLVAAGTTRPAEVRAAVRSRLFSAPWRPGEVPAAVLDLARAALDAPTMDRWATDPVALLLTHGERSDLARIERMLLEGSSQSRSAAANSLQQLAGPEAQRLLLLLADDPEPSVRQAALIGLLKRGLEAEVEDRIIRHLEAGKIDYGGTEHLLVRLGTPRAVDFLLKRIETGTSREWSSAVHAIASAGSAEDVERLLKVADRTDNPQLEQAILGALVHSDTADLEGLVNRALKSGSPQLVSTATQALVRLGTDEARDKLVTLAGAEASDTRRAALSALAQVGGPAAERALIAALSDEDVPWTAVSGLQQLGTEAARDALIEAARGGAPAPVRASVMFQLSSMHGVDGAAILGQAIRADEDPTVRSSAIGALAMAGTTQAAETLASLLDDASLDEQERAQAASSLQGLGGPVAEQHADRIAELAPPVDTGLRAPQELYFDE